MKYILLVIVSLIVSCGGGEDDNSVIQTIWISDCFIGADDNHYVETEFVFYDGAFDLNSAIYIDSECTTFWERSEGFINLLEFTYEEYEIVTSESGLEVVWYNSYIQSEDSEEAPLEAESGFYFEGDTMYEANLVGDIYLVDFSRAYHKQ